MRKYCTSVTVLALVLFLAVAPASRAATVLGTGTGALLTSDLSDPENDINDNVPGNLPYYGDGYNWAAAFSNIETHFSPGGPTNEAALDLFDNKVGGGSDKWYNGGIDAWVALQFEEPYVLTHFTIAGQDRNFVEAQAEIDGETVVVHADGVASPVAVRFGWHQEAEPNLSNRAGLPASPFRTDAW